MHGKGWVHRDIKPENFLVNDTGQVKLIDFGLAQRPSGWLAKILPMKPKRQGTPSYMSPEQIRCGALDQRADVYSFGCVLYELVAGAPPYTGSTQEELFGKHLKSAVPSAGGGRRQCHRRFCQFGPSLPVQRCRGPAGFGPGSPGRVSQDADVQGFPASFRHGRTVRSGVEDSRRSIGLAATLHERILTVQVNEDGGKHASLVVRTAYLRVGSPYPENWKPLARRRSPRPAMRFAACGAS